MLTYFGAGEPHEVEAWGAYDITPLSRHIAGLTNLHREFADDPSDFDICAPSKDAVAVLGWRLCWSRMTTPSPTALANSSGSAGSRLSDQRVQRSATVANPSRTSREDSPSWQPSVRISRSART